MLLNVPYNWDLELLKALGPYKGSISEFYASLPSSICGNIRHPDSIRYPPEKDDVKAHINEIHRFGARFFYLVNVPFMGNIEFIQTKEVYDYIAWIKSIGADGLVIGSPALLEFVQKNFPDFKIKLSISSEVDSPQKAHIFYKQGVDCITLPDSINRQFETLRKMNDFCEVELLLNNLCILNCPLRVYHACFTGQNSRETKNKLERFDEYPVMWCSHVKAKNPVELIKSPWIRPEDIKKYEKLGIKKFKISGREKKTNWIRDRVKIYVERNYDGNVLDYLNTVLYGFPKFTPSIHIDNKKLNNFIDYFYQGNCDLNCKDCNHCKGFFETALTIEGDMEGYIKSLEKKKNKLLDF